MSMPPGQDMLHQAWRRSYPGLWAIGLFSILINILKLAMPIYLLQVLDRVVASRSVETLIMLTVITVLAMLTYLLLEVVRRQLFMGWGVWIERTFGPKLFTGTFKRDSHAPPAISKALRDVKIVGSFVSGTGLIAWLDLIWALLFITCVWLICSTLAYIVIVASIITILLGTLNEKITRSSRDATFQAGKDDREWIAATERNQETIASRSMANNLADRWSLSAFTRLGEGLRTRSVNIYFVTMMRFVRHSLRIGIIGVGIWLVISDTLTLGAVFAAGVLARMAYSLIEQAMLRWRDMTIAIKAYQRIKTSLKRDTEQSVSVPTAPEPAPLYVEGVSYRYPSQSLSLFRNVNVTVNPAEVLCIIGPSAVGKTTFTRLISGLLTPRSGNIRLGDVDVARLQEVTDKRYIGNLPQQVGLFHSTVRENIAGMEMGDIDQVIEAAKLMGVHDVIMTLPQGYDTPISDCEPLLSGGQRKKIAIARAFYGNPPLIVLDEPLPHLDKQSRSTLRAAIRAVKSKGTIIVLTNQSKSLCRIADKVIVLDDKKHQLLETPEAISEYRHQKRNNGRVYQLNRRARK